MLADPEGPHRGGSDVGWWPGLCSLHVSTAGEAQAVAVRGTGLRPVASRPGLTSAEPQQPFLAQSSLERFLNEPHLFIWHCAAQLFEAPSFKRRSVEAHLSADDS